MKRLTKLELEAVRIVVQEHLAGSPYEFFKDACGKPDAEAEKLAAALESAADKL